MSNMSISKRNTDAQGEFSVLTNLPMEFASQICGEASQYPLVIGMFVAPGSPQALLLKIRKFCRVSNNKSNINTHREFALMTHLPR